MQFNFKAARAQVARILGLQGYADCYVDATDVGVLLGLLLAQLPPSLRLLKLLANGTANRMELVRTLVDWAFTLGKPLVKLKAITSLTLLDQALPGNTALTACHGMKHNATAIIGRFSQFSCLTIKTWPLAALASLSAFPKLANLSVVSGSLESNSLASPVKALVVLNLLP